MRRQVKKDRLQRKHHATLVGQRDLLPNAVLQRNIWSAYHNPSTFTAAGAMVHYVFCLNSVWDPFQYNVDAIGGDTIENWSTMASNYSNYMVRGCKFRFQALPYATTTSVAVNPYQMVWWIDNKGDNPTTRGELLNTQGLHGRNKLYYVNVLYGNTPFRPGLITKYINISKHLPSPLNEDLDRAITSGSGVQNNPRRAVFLHITLVNQDAAASFYPTFNMYMRFYTKWWNKVNHYDSINTASSTTTVATGYPAAPPS